jgi:tetratricopeptide (TPR) repeat protein
MDPSRTIAVIEAALASGEHGFARRAAESVLREQPGHLAAQVALARTLFALGQPAVAVAQLMRVVQVDPEDLGAWQVLADVREARGQRAELINAAAAALALSPRDSRLRARVVALTGGTVPAWLNTAITARLALDDGHYDEARANTAQLQAFAIAPIPALVELEAAWRAGDTTAAHRLAQNLLVDSPRLVKPRLIMAECLLAAGGSGSEQAVALLHEAEGLDPAGQVAARLWGDTHRFRMLWPLEESEPWSEPLPASVVTTLGWNRLAPGAAPAPAAAPQANPAAPKVGEDYRPGDTQPLPPLPDEKAAQARAASARLVASVLKDIRAEVTKLTRQAHPKQKVGQAHVILTSRARLEAKYGADGFAQISQLLKRLEDEVAARRPELAPGIVYVDDAACLSQFHLEPVDPQHPWAVKGLLADLDTLVRSETHDKSELGSLLIVGGDDIIAHHRLPNPAEDSDSEVLSDNPYAARDENYFVADRAVGRLPDGAGDLKTLCRSLETAIAAHQAPALATKPWWQVLFELLFKRIASVKAAKQTGVFGYSASVWRRASATVFEALGGNIQSLRICPPTTYADFQPLEFASPTYAYFNLHGVPDGPDWYGQRDPSMVADYAPFPVALRPQNLNGAAPRAVFSEACYGASASGHSADDSIAMRFLAGGAQAVVASTCIAYGGVGTPLVGADLLGRLFWQEVTAGTATGEALRRAKLALARIMQQGQGALDGEDQKTLISFVLYGDPTVRINTTEPGGAKTSWAQMIDDPALVCSKGATVEAVFDAPMDLVAQVKREVAHYLPGMETAEIRCSHLQRCRGKHPAHECPAQVLGTEADGAEGPDPLVFTLHKVIPSGDHQHERIVRVTANRKGQVVKMAVSK